MEADILSRILIELAFDLCNDWKRLGRMLGLHKQTEQISADYKGSVTEQGYRMLVKWSQNEGTKATREALARGLKNASRNDLVEKYCGEGREFSAIEEIGNTKNGKVSDSDIDGIAQDLGKEWLWVGRLLGLDDSSLDQISQDANQTMYECSYQMLTSWTKKDASGATYNQLAQVLLHRVVQMRNIAEKYCLAEPESQESAGASGFHSQETLDPLTNKMEGLKLTPTDGSASDLVRQETCADGAEQDRSNYGQGSQTSRRVPDDCVWRKSVTELPFPVWKELGIKLDPLRTSGGDFRDLASEFGCNMDTIWYLKSLQSPSSPTETLLRDNLPPIDELCIKLDKIERSDAKSSICDWVSSQDCKCSACDSTSS